MTAVVTARALSIGYRGHPLLPPFDVTVVAGEVVLIVGRNGCGKSTFVKTALGLVAPLAGTCELRPGTKPVLVPQASTLDPFVPLQVHEVVGLGRQRGWSFLRPWQMGADRAEVDRALAATNLTEMRRKRFAELSGGQQQRVMLARVVASGADLVVLDEPTAAMDAASERIAYEQIRTLALDRDISMLVITHSVAVAAPYADRIAFFDPDDREEGSHGRVAVGPAAAIAADPRFQHMFGRIETRQEAS